MVVDFIGIGAQKSATSWLYKMLKQHPDLWVPPRKELHYFDRSLKYASPSFLATDKYIDRIDGLDAHNMLFKEKMKQELLDIKSVDIVKREWFKKYFQSNYDDRWYKSLFEEGKGRIKGEITPAYSILSQEDILHIKNLFPKLKVIFIMRDPVERAWSQIRFFMDRKKLNDTASFEELIKFIESPNLSSRGDYVRTLNNWNTYFHNELFIGCYEDIKSDPIHFLNQIFIFLGVKPLATQLKGIYKKVNISDTTVTQMDAQLKEYLVGKYMPQIEVLSNDYPCAKKWLYKYKE